MLVYLVRCLKMMKMSWGIPHHRILRQRSVVRTVLVPMEEVVDPEEGFAKVEVRPGGQHHLHYPELALVQPWEVVELTNQGYPNYLQLHPLFWGQHIQNWSHSINEVIKKLSGPQQFFPYCCLYINRSSAILRAATTWIHL